MFPRIIRCKKSAARDTFLLRELSALSFRTRVTCAHAHYTLLKKLSRAHLSAKYTHAHNNGIMLWRRRRRRRRCLTNSLQILLWMNDALNWIANSLGRSQSEEGDKSAAVCSMLLLIICTERGPARSRQLIKAHTTHNNKTGASWIWYSRRREEAAENEKPTMRRREVMQHLGGPQPAKLTHRPNFSLSGFAFLIHW